MNLGIRRVGVAMIVLFLALVAQLTYLQVVRSDQLADDPRNPRKFLAQHQPRPRADRHRRRRGRRAVGADRRRVQVPARVPAARDAVRAGRRLPVVRVRQRPASRRRTTTQLAGRDIELAARATSPTSFAASSPTGTVVLTLSPRRQQAAADALGGQRGSVVVLDVQTGGVVAMYSNPTFDPNPLASHDTKDVQAACTFLLDATRQPAARRARGASSTRRARRSRRSPRRSRSTEQRRRRQAVPVRRPRSRCRRRTAGRCSNFGGETCGGTLDESFVVSCNTTFAPARPRPRRHVRDRHASGSASNTDAAAARPRPGVGRSIGPDAGTFKTDKPPFALAGDRPGHGRGHAAPDGAGRGGGRERRRDHRAARRRPRSRTPTARSSARSTRSSGRRAMRPATAATHDATDDRGRRRPRAPAPRRRSRASQVAGKTGTAETGAGENPHAWFIAFAPADAPAVRGRGARRARRRRRRDAEATGGRVAAPIAAAGAPGAARARNRCDRSRCGAAQPVECDERQIGFRHR